MCWSFPNFCHKSAIKFPLGKRQLFYATKFSTRWRKCSRENHIFKSRAEIQQCFIIHYFILSCRFFGLSLIVWCILQQLNTSTKTITGVLLMLTHRPLKHKPYYLEITTCNKEQVKGITWQELQR